MIAFLEAVKVKYGGMDMSVMNVTGLSKADVEILQTVLRGEIWSDQIRFWSSLDWLYTLLLNFILFKQ